MNLKIKNTEPDDSYNNLKVKIDVRDQEEQPVVKRTYKESMSKTGGTYKGDFIFNQDLYGTGEKSGSENGSGAEDKDLEGSHIYSVNNPPEIDQNDNIYEFYEYLRNEFRKNGNQWDDPEFTDDISTFFKHGEKETPDRIKQYNIEFERTEDTGSEENHFFSTNSGSNIQYEFKIKRGIMNDKFFLGALLMLFRKKEEFFTNLVVDYKNIKENIAAGFCGFTFFINGEWKIVTVDTKLPWHQTDDMTLSVAVSNQTSFWLSLFEKAYSKIHKNYNVLNNVSIKNTLVDFTGGISKKIQIKDKMEDFEKKNLFDELRRCMGQKYLMGCMKYEDTEDDVLY